MRHKKLIILIILLVIVVIGIFVKLFFFDDEQVQETQFLTNREKYTTNSQNQSIKLNKDSEVISALTEKIELHATYYLEEVVASENQLIKQGENILKYTNGEYLVAPYDCIISEFNVPEVDGKCLNSHYIEVQSSKILALKMKIDEKYINKVQIGDNANISINAASANYIGYVTHISSTASNGTFEITIEFENDEKIRLGMTASIEMEI